MKALVMNFPTSVARRARQDRSVGQDKFRFIYKSSVIYNFLRHRFEMLGFA